MNTLLYFYADKKVDISGKWKGEEKVNGTKCKKFWIEGIELNDEK